MDLMSAIKIWADCDGERDCEKCPLYDPNPDEYSVCNLLSEAWQTLEGKRLIIPVYLN